MNEGTNKTTEHRPNRVSMTNSFSFSCFVPLAIYSFLLPPLISLFLLFFFASFIFGLVFLKLFDDCKYIR
jgi:hypothetical protein